LPLGWQISFLGTGLYIVPSTQSRVIAVVALAFWLGEALFYAVGQLGASSGSGSAPLAGGPTHPYPTPRLVETAPFQNFAVATNEFRGSGAAEPTEYQNLRTWVQGSLSPTPCP
jgi:hypothetical protein